MKTTLLLASLALLLALNGCGMAVANFNMFLARCAEGTVFVGGPHENPNASTQPATQPAPRFDGGL